MNIRTEFIAYLESIKHDGNHYEKLKSCLILEGKKDINTLDEWFEGFIKSLFYKPNEELLFIFGKQNIGKTEFLRRLLPERYKLLYKEQSPNSIDSGSMSNNLLIVTDDFYIGRKEMSRLKSLVSSHNFKTRGKYGLSDFAISKRLCSFAVTSNVPPKDNTGIRRTISLCVKGINQELYNSIDKSKLFAELLEKFRPDKNKEVPGKVFDRNSQFEGLGKFVEYRCCQCGYGIPAEGSKYCQGCLDYNDQCNG